MDTRTARFLNNLNRQFYDACVSSFSDTRSVAWPGWRVCLDAMSDARAGGADDGAFRVLDVACGNMRFESFLANELGERPYAACAIDTCEELARTGAEAFGLHVRFEDTADRPFLAECLEAGEIRFLSNDVIVSMLGGESLGFSDFDAAVCFGFFHHVPGQTARTNLLDQLCASVRPGGVVAISLWRFLDDDRLARKAHETTERARIDLAAEFDWDVLDAGDCFLGWQDRSDVYRYAHSFSDADIDGLIDAMPPCAQLAARFRADGRTGGLNEYLVFRITRPT